MSNPYEPLAPSYGGPEDNPEGPPLASRGQRFGAQMLDAIIGVVISLPIMFATGTFDRIGRNETDLGMTLVSAGLGFVAFFIAHGYLLATSGQTIGKRLVGIRIVDFDTNEVPSFGRLVFRYASVQLPAMIPCIGAVWGLADALAIFREECRCLHDNIAGTKVVIAND